MAKNDLSPKEIEFALNELEAQIKALRVAYDQYFMGVDRRPPELKHKDVVRMMHTLEHRTFIRQTALKFRLRSLSQRFNTYNSYWNRIMRQIEAGTYVRDVQRGKRREQRRAARVDRQEELEAAMGIERDEQGAIALGDLDFDMNSIDLGSLQEELEQLDARGTFDARAPELVREPVHAHALQSHHTRPPSPPNENRAMKLSELQQKLSSPHGALSSAPRPSSEQSRRAKLEDIKRKLQARQSASTMESGAQAAGVHELPTQGASVDRLRRLRADKERMQRATASRQASPPSSNRNRVIQRNTASNTDSGNPNVQRVYRNLLEAKRRCNESTDTLSYESVARSMAQQRDRLRSSHGAREVDFKVVIKNGRAFLKPEPK
ncbi:MAG: MXAN_5187 C-terminal domain-containing protein [Myxococcota bacterium]